MPIITYAVPAPIFKSHFQKVTLVPFPDTSVNLRCPAPQLQKFTKVLLVPFPTPIITYAIQRPSSNVISKVFLVPFQTPIITYAIQRPSHNLHSDFDAITPKPTTFDPTRKLIPTYFQNINQNLMLFQNVKRSMVTFDLAIFGLKVPCFSQVPLHTSDSVVQLF